MSVPDRITVKVPATTANLGPGFDAMGMALDLWNTVTVTPGNSEVSIEGEGEDELPRDESNVVVVGIHSALRALGKSVPELAVRCENRIPLSRGLGSSSAATVAGLLAGLAMAGRDLDQRLLFDLAADIEGHPDNAAPAVYGGCCISVKRQRRVGRRSDATARKPERSCVHSRSEHEHLRGASRIAKSGQP